MNKFLAETCLSLLIFALNCGFCVAKVQHYGVRILKEYPHSTTSYTQGLFFCDSQLCESTGQYGGSTFRKLDKENGQELFRLDFSRKYFMEGSVVLNGRLYILTWLEKEIFVYDFDTMKLLQSCAYPREGWGLTTDGKSLIASDGSDKLYFMDENLNVHRTVSVTIGGNPLNCLNELEWIDGKIWANVYTTDKIVIIDPSDGSVRAVVDCDGLLPEFRRTPNTDVLNGIAQDPRDGSIYLTGKNWPALFQIELISK